MYKRQVLDEMEAYSKLLLPVMCGAAAASGSLTGAGSLYMLSLIHILPSGKPRATLARGFLFPEIVRGPPG